MRLPAVLRYLVFFLPVLVVSFAVLMGAGAIARLAGDTVAEWVMQSAAVGVALAMAINTILLVGVLGIKALVDTERQDHRRMKMEHMKKRWKRGRGRGRGRRGDRHEDRDHGHKSE